MSEVFELIPAHMVDKSLDERFNIAMINLGNALGTFSKRQDDVEDSLESVQAELVGDNGNKPGLPAIREQHKELKKRGVLTLLDKLADRFNMERSISLLFIAQTIAIIVALII